MMKGWLVLQEVLMKLQTSNQLWKVNMNSRNGKKHERQSNWTAKILHEQIITQTEHLADEQQWLWVKDGTLK